MKIRAFYRTVKIFDDVIRPEELAATYSPGS